MKKLCGLFFYIIVLALPIWLIGFGIFVLYVFSFRISSEQPVADAIVAWTGGGYRIQSAVTLLEKGMGQKLLISGVNKNARPHLFLGEIDPDLKNKITLGYVATTTQQNALEPSEWMYQNKFKSAILVTSFYHIPRSLVEFQHEMPLTTVYPYPIWPKDFTESVSWIHTRSAFHLLIEYHKFVFVKMSYFIEGLSK